MISPLVIFAFNRPKYLEKCLKSLKLNKLSRQTITYFFIDYPKLEKDFKNYNKVIKIVRETNIFKKKIIIQRKYNYGLKKNILNGIDYVLKKNETIIVLEDDLYLSKYFLDYMNKYLNFFKNSKNIASIHGYCYPIDKKNLNNFFLLRGADCWGWATWRRAWKYYNDDNLMLAKKIKSKNEIDTFNFNNSFNYYEMLFNRSSSIWAINWYASAFIKNMFTLYPKNSYVRNMGNSGLGTHSNKIDKRFDISLCKSFKFEKLVIAEDVNARKKFEEFFKYNFKKKYIFLKKIKNLIVSMKKLLFKI
jgi:hypothetical protein